MQQWRGCGRHTGSSGGKEPAGERGLARGTRSPRLQPGRCWAVGVGSGGDLIQVCGSGVIQGLQ